MEISDLLIFFSLAEPKTNKRKVKEKFFFCGKIISKIHTESGKKEEKKGKAKQNL